MTEETILTIGVTEVGGCMRKLQHKFLKTPKLPYHSMSLRGIVSHEAISNELQEKEFTFELNEKNFERDIELMDIEVFEAIKEEAKQTYHKFEEWKEITEISFDNATVEELLRSEPNDGIQLVGKPDAFTEASIIDFKSGKKVVRMSHIEQLCGYRYLLKELKGIDDPSCTIVYLGGDEPVEVVLSTSQVSKGDIAFKEKLGETMETANRVLDGEDIPCKVTFTCVFCPFRHKCSGI